MRYIINPSYLVRPEGDKAIVISKQGYGMAGTLNVIHPIYGMILSFFDGRELEKAYSDIAEYMDIPTDMVKAHISPLLDNNDFVHNGESVFPPHFLIPFDEESHINPTKLNPEDFIYDPDSLDVSMGRLKSPIDIICNLTLRCVTSCVYCYADRKGHQNKMMPIELLRKILAEAHEIGVVRFKLMGGEILLYPDWDEVVKLSIEYGFQPDISIKKPMTEEEVLKWKNLKATTDPIQISLDTLILPHLTRILNVSSSYKEEIMRTFELLDAHEVPYVVHTVVNRFNDSIEDVKSVYEFLKGRKCLKGWMMDAAKCSMYNGLPYSEYRTSEEKINPIRDFVDEINTSGDFDFMVQPPRMLRDFNHMPASEKSEIFKNRKMCSGNLSALYILPDGKVTICEEMYWHPRFILGDLNHHTLQEIWDSPKAKELFYLQQKSIPSDSPCSECEDFSECRKYKHVCWRDTILAYGKDKWYYPDITCPKAPVITNDIAMK